MKIKNNWLKFLVFIVLSCKSFSVENADFLGQVQTLTKYNNKYVVCLKQNNPSETINFLKEFSYFFVENYRTFEKNDYEFPTITIEAIKHCCNIYSSYPSMINKDIYYRLGQYFEYLHELSEDKDLLEEVINYYTQASGNGSGKASFKLSQLYFSVIESKNNNVDSNQKSFDLLKLALSQGYIKAYSNFGSFYLNNSIHETKILSESKRLKTAKLYFQKALSFEKNKNRVMGIKLNINEIDNLLKAEQERKEKNRQSVNKLLPGNVKSIESKIIPNIYVTPTNLQSQIPTLIVALNGRKETATTLPPSKKRQNKSSRLDNQKAKAEVDKILNDWQKAEEKENKPSKKQKKYEKQITPKTSNVLGTGSKKENVYIENKEKPIIEIADFSPVASIPQPSAKSVKIQASNGKNTKNRRHVNNNKQGGYLMADRFSGGEKFNSRGNAPINKKNTHKNNKQNTVLSKNTAHQSPTLETGGSIKNTTSSVNMTVQQNISCHLPPKKTGYEAGNQFSPHYQSTPTQGYNKEEKFNQSALQNKEEKTRGKLYLQLTESSETISNPGEFSPLVGMNKESRIEAQVNPSLNMSNGKENINQEKSDLNVMKDFDENHIIIETLLEENCKLKEQNEQLTDYNKSLKRIANFALGQSYELAKELYQK